MPNWCFNKLTVTNSTPELEAFLKEHGLSFEAIVKPNRPENDEHGFETVSAQVHAWGTKWDLPDDEAKEAAAFLLNDGECNFDTAWSPPIQAIEALSAKFPQVNFSLHYYETGCMFWGVADFWCGSVEDECYSGSMQECSLFLQKEMDYDEASANCIVGLDDEEEELEDEE